MVKRRELQTSNKKPTEQQIEAFISGADKPQENALLQASLDPNATRDFKSIRVSFNEFEYKMLDDGRKKSGRTKLNFIRQAILKLAEEELGKK